MQKMTGSERQFSNLRWGPPAQKRSAEALIDIEIWGLGYLWSNDLPLFRLQKMLDKKRKSALNTRCKCQPHPKRFHATN